jgi:hypothetical protein
MKFWIAVGSDIKLLLKMPAAKEAVIVFAETGRLSSEFAPVSTGAPAW